MRMMWMVRVTGTTRLRVSEMMRMLTCQEDWGWKNKYEEG